MKTLPQSIIDRPELNLRQGIKSSLSNIRVVVSLIYLLYVANDKKAYIEYSDEGKSGGITFIKIKPNLSVAIAAILPSITESALNNLPLFKSQMEALQVGIELFLKLGKISFNDSISNSIERTGGNRYNKNIRFGTNIKLIDIYLTSLSENDRSGFLTAWLHNNPYSNSTIEGAIIRMLTIFTEETQFKIRNAGAEIIFQQEGIYNKILLGNTVESNDEKEQVGPYRIYKSYVREGLHPFISDSSGQFDIKPSIKDEFEEYAQLVSNSLSLIPKRTIVTQIETENGYIEEDKVINISSDIQQRIYYGAPGTGKSHKIKLITKEKNATKVTFHPDTDYSSFVGCYKPKVKDTGTEITYGFVPQAFAKAYVAAWKNLEEPYYLVIEEINRGNCAQIFGDIFQLLDRSDDGFSKYVIDVDSDLAAYLKCELNEIESYHNKISELAEVEVSRDDYSKIALPCNLSILATMNTSDQSLFPMDSAFKRRWDWEYLPIDSSKVENIIIDIDGSHYSWSKFLDTVNQHIYEVNTSEDKQLGPFFVKANDGTDTITFEQFRSKVMFYLWFEIYKDEERDSIFKINHGTEENKDMKPFTFGDLFKDNGTELLNKFMQDSMKLDVENKPVDEPAATEVANEE